MAFKFYALLSYAILRWLASQEGQYVILDRRGLLYDVRILVSNLSFVRYTYAWLLLRNIVRSMLNVLVRFGFQLPNLKFEPKWMIILTIDTAKFIAYTQTISLIRRDPTLAESPTAIQPDGNTRIGIPSREIYIDS